MELLTQHDLGKIMPRMEKEQYKTFTADITKNGLQSPIVLYEGKVLDGWNRYNVCISSSVEPRFETYTGTTPATFVMSSNMERRHLTAGQKACVSTEILPFVEEETKRNRQYVSKDIRTISGPGPLMECDSNKRKSASKVAKIFRISDKSVFLAKKLKKEDPEIFEKVKSGGYTLNDAKRNVKAKKIDAQRKQLIENSKNLKTSELVILKQGDCLELSRELKDNSISLIVTDPPYPAEFIDCWTKLGKIAMRVLQPSGFCVAYSGKLHLPEVIQRMTAEGLVYYWQFILLHSGLPAAVHGRKINTGYKPILVFQKPPFKQISSYCSDIIKGSGREKEGHDWQQAEGELKQLFDIFYEGGTVLEPYAGSGTVLSYCKANKIPVIGYELDKDSYQISLARIGE